MVQINFAQKEIQCKVVYYGPGMSGKTTNLELVHAKAPDDHRGELTSIATTGERTLYFDYMPLDLGQIAGISTKFQLYTVPGQIYYKSTRRLVLQGVDGIVFVADSSAAKLRENKESLADLADNLKEMGKNLTDIPIVIQYNKRDLPDAMTIEELEKELNEHEFPMTEATATLGEGVFPTLKMLAGMVLEAVNKGGLATARARSAKRPAKTAVPAVETPAAVPSREPAMAAAQAAAPAAPAAAPAAAPEAPAAPAEAPAAATPAPGAPEPPPPGPAVEPPPPTNHASPPAAAPQEAAPTTYNPRSMQDRVVAVHDLKVGGDSKLLLMAGLALLIAGAVAFVVLKL